MFEIEVHLIYSVGLVSVVWHSDSITFTFSLILSCILVYGKILNIGPFAIQSKTLLFICFVREFICIIVLFFNFIFFVFLPFLGPLPTAYGGSQSRGLIGDTAAGLVQSHSNSGSEPRLWPTP